MHPCRFWTLFIILTALATVLVCTAFGHAAPARCSRKKTDPKNHSAPKKVVVKIGRPYISEYRLPAKILPLPTFPKVKK